MLQKQYYVYILSNERNTVLYTGISDNLVKRVYQHKNKITKGFTSRYNITKLVYYEIAHNPTAAILREKQIKAGSRKDKVVLIESMNPEWKDLYDEIV